MSGRGFSKCGDLPRNSEPTFLPEPLSLQTQDDPREGVTAYHLQVCGAIKSPVEILVLSH